MSEFQTLRVMLADLVARLRDDEDGVITTESAVVIGAAVLLAAAVVAVIASKVMAKVNSISL
jgi:Flp pilus assembly pilin Flp